MKYNIAVLPGDGVGPEVVGEAVRVLEEVQKIVTGFELDMQKYSVGSNQYLKTGVVMTDEVYKDCESAHAIMLGALGQPAPGQSVLDENGTEVTGRVMFRIRFGLSLFAGVRPIKLYPGVPSALAGHDKIDFVVLREQCEGLFASYGGGSVLYDDLATDTQIITRKGVERAAEFGFKLAMSRNGRVKDGKKLLTLADKSNVFRSFAFMRKVFNEVAKKYEGMVASENTIVDAMSLWLVQHPEDYDVILFENMHGDIISDMAAAFVGGMGMAPSGDIGWDHAMFQPSHGTAPTIIGKGIANPTATILSGKMMLAWLGERFDDANLNKAADMIEQAVYNTFVKGIRTPDVAGTASTTQFTDEVIAQLRALR